MQAQINMQKAQQQCDEISSQKLQLSVSCINLADLDSIPVTDSFLVIKLYEPNKAQKTVLKSKVYLNNLNPDYAETVTIQYVFKIRQKLKFEVYHEASPPKLVGQAQYTLGQIFGSPSNAIQKDLKNKKDKNSGQIIVKCRRVTKQANKMIEFVLQCSGQAPSCACWWFKSTCNSFYKVYRDDLLIYQSQVICGKQNPTFKSCQIQQMKLCKNKPDAKFQIRLYKNSENGKHQQMGRAITSVNAILDPRAIPILDSMSRAKGKIRFRGVNRYAKITFTDYLAAGLELMLITCIDFTTSNGSPQLPQSLHYIAPEKKSAYQQALQQVSRILLDYDYDKLVPVYGFGATVSMPNLNSQGQVHNFFALNGNKKNAHVCMVEGIMKAYRDAMQYLKFSGPTYFNVLLNQAIQQCYKIQKQINKYIILFILTDGQIDDEKEVIDQIIECCKLPISLIIVGVGNGPFERMRKLDDDNCQLVDSKGRKTTRDLVQFVEFTKFKNDGVELAKEVLEQLPRQVEQYYQMMNLGPDKLLEVRKPGNSSISSGPPKQPLYQQQFKSPKYSSKKSNAQQISRSQRH